MLELEKASAKIDRFGWDRMEQVIKDGLMSDWVDTLGPFPIPKIKAGIKRLFEKAKGNMRSINEEQVKEAILEMDRIELARLPKTPEPVEAPKAPPSEAEKARVADLVAGFTKKATIKGGE